MPGRPSMPSPSSIPKGRVTLSAPYSFSFTRYCSSAVLILHFHRLDVFCRFPALRTLCRTRSRYVSGCVISSGENPRQVRPVNVAFASPVRQSLNGNGIVVPQDMQYASLRPVESADAVFRKHLFQNPAQILFDERNLNADFFSPWKPRSNILILYSDNILLYRNKSRQMADVFKAKISVRRLPFDFGMPARRNAACPARFCARRVCVLFDK